MFPSRTNDQTPFGENALSDWKKNERTVVDYRDKNLELQLTSASAYLQACMIRQCLRARVLSTAADVKYLGSVGCMVATISELHLLLPMARHSKTSCNS